MKVGTRPPLNNMVKKTKKEKKFLPGSFFRDRGYASMEDKIKCSAVPTMVTPMVMA